MSQYDNPAPDHSVNVSPGSPLGEFFSLSLWLALGTVLVVVAIYLGARWLAPLVPFGWEQRMAAPVVQALTEEDHASPLASCRQQWLQALAQDLRAPMGVPADMPITVHWSSSSVPNAFATLGGHVVIHQGLIDAVKSENALAMVLAHEMARGDHLAARLVVHVLELALAVADLGKENHVHAQVLAQAVQQLAHRVIDQAVAGGSGRDQQLADGDLQGVGRVVPQMQTHGRAVNNTV